MALNGLNAKLIAFLMVITPMTPEHATIDVPECGDREVIRVDFAHDKLGIAAALRQAFAAAAQDRSNHDFDKLLSELH